MRRRPTLRLARRQRLQLGVLGTALLACLAAVAAWAAIQQEPKLPSSIKAVTATLATLVSLLIGTIVSILRNRIGQHAQINRRLQIGFRFWTLRGGPRVRDVTEPRRLGVHHAAAPLALSHVEQADPAYVRRTRDDSLDEALRLHPFVLLVGDSTAGKSRSAYEAMQRLFPDRLLLAPGAKASLTLLDELELRLPDSVLWLDELDRYLGDDGLTVPLLERLISSQHSSVTLLATMRAAVWHDYTAESDVRRDERAVLRLAHRIPLGRRFDSTEIERAKELSQDPWIAAAIPRLATYGLAEYLAAGPPLLEKFHLAHGEVQPSGAAIVRAAIDWQRAGLRRAIPRAILERLYVHYVVEGSQSRHVGERDFATGLDWASEPILGGTTPALISEVAQDSYQAFDYLLDHYEQHADQYPIPMSTWLALAAALTEADELGALGVAAYQTGERDLSELLWRRAAQAGGIGGAHNLIVLLEERGKKVEAEAVRKWVAEGRDRLQHVLASGGATDLGNLPDLLAPLVEMGGLQDAHIETTFERLQMLRGTTEASSVTTCRFSIDHVIKQEQWHLGIVTKRRHRERLRQCRVPLDEVRVVETNPLGGQPIVDEVTGKYDLSVQYLDEDGRFVDAPLEMLRDVSHIWQPLTPEDEFPLVVLRAVLPPLAHNRTRRIKIVDGQVVPRDMGVWWWTASSPVYVSSIKINAAELTQDSDCTLVKALPSSQDLEQGENGTWLIKVDGWVIAGHGVTFYWTRKQ